MKKKSYTNRRPEKNTETFNEEVPSPSSGEEGLSADSASGVGRGYFLPGESVHPYQSEKETYVRDKAKSKRRSRVKPKDITNLFVMLADEMDKKGEVDLANFADYMIAKIASQKMIDYSDLLKKLIIKIVESDIMNKNILIEDLVKVFNRVVSINVSGGSSLSEAKMEAYQSVVLRAEKYVK